MTLFGRPVYEFEGGGQSPGGTETSYRAIRRILIWYMVYGVQDVIWYMA